MHLAGDEEFGQALHRRKVDITLLVEWGNHGCNYTLEQFHSVIPPLSCHTP